jgi:hypothetical protein
MSTPGEAAEPVSRFLPLTMASALFSAGRGSHFTAAQFILPFVSLGLVTALAVPVYTRLAAQAGAHMRNDGKVSP